MLTDGQASAAQAGDKDYKLADANGLYLFVTRSGFKSWRMKYRFGGKEKRLTFGPYPEVSLEEARERRDQARRLLRDQIDPALERQRLREPEAELTEGDAVEADPPVSAEVDPVPRSVKRDGSARVEESAQLPLPEPAPMPPAFSAAGQAQPRPVEPPAPAEPPAGPRRPGHIVSSRLSAYPVPSSPVRAGLMPTPADPLGSSGPASEPPAAPVDETPMPPLVSVGSEEPAVPLAAADEPAEAAPFTPEVTAGSRALALLKQAEHAAETAASQSRAAKRLAALALALLVVLGVGFGWWMLRGRPVTAPLAAIAPVAGPPRAAIAAAASATPAAVPVHPAVTAHPGAPVATPTSSVAAAPTPVAAAHTAVNRSATVDGTAGSKAKTSPASRSHHGRHHHRRYHHRRRHHVASKLPASSATPSHHLFRETHNDVQVTARPRSADSIDPSLDRAGRAALCLRAAYSADPGCAALRAAGRQ